MSKDNVAFDSNVNLENSKALVDIKLALDDVLVISYEVDSRIFQGILLDSSKRNGPYGINILEIAEKNPKQFDDDGGVLRRAIDQRLTYFQTRAVDEVNSKNKAKVPKMGVRLRPRQVLCSKCKSICNEKSENIETSKRVEERMEQVNQDYAQDIESDVGSIKCSPINKLRSGTSVCHSRGLSNRLKLVTLATSGNLSSSLVPRLSRLNSREIDDAINGKYKSDIGKDTEKSDVDMDTEKSDVGKDTEEQPKKSVRGRPCLKKSIERKVVTRKSHSTGSLGEQKNNKVFVESRSTRRTTTPILKISYGSEGRGAVLEIPSKVKDSATTDEEEEEMWNDKRNGSADSSNEKIHTSQKKKSKEIRKRKYDDTEEKPSERKIATLNLKRINDEEYVTKNSSPTEEGSSSSNVPNFPKQDAVIKPIDSTKFKWDTKSGTSLTIGDIVWGKVRGIPWWPAKVIEMKTSERDTTAEYVNIAWFGCRQTTIVPCVKLCPYLECYELKFCERKKYDGYEDAVKQATFEAKEKEAFQMSS